MKHIAFLGALTVYSAVLFLIQPILAGYLLYRAKKQPEYLRGWSERFLAAVPLCTSKKAKKQRIWVHVVSVGETHAISPLVSAWVERNPDHVWVFSSTTPTGQETARRLFSHLNEVRFFYLPYDLPWLIYRCLHRLAPTQLWLVETEIWPNLIVMAKRVGVLVSLINARVSPRTAVRMNKLSWLAKPVFENFHRVTCQTQMDARVFEKLGRPVDAVCGNLKFDVARQEHLAHLGCLWKAQASGPVLLLASSREGEEVLFLEALVREQFFKRLPQARVWIVPRHPQRFDEVFDLMLQVAPRLGVSRLSRRRDFEEASNQLVSASSLASASLILGDSMGEMPAYYSAADVALLGGSWLPFGGQNLIEASAYGCPVWMGAHTFNFFKVAGDALAAGAARRFDSLQAACSSFLLEHTRLDTDRAQALVFAASHVGATQATLAVLAELDKSSNPCAGLGADVV